MNPKKMFVVMMVLVSATLVVSLASALAQVDTAWVRRHNGSIDGNDWANAIAVDDSGNVYVTGAIDEVWKYHIGPDYCTIKYRPDGDTAWSRAYGDPEPDGAWEEALGIAVDSCGNVYVTGFSSGIGTNYDYATMKYYPDGNPAWVSRYDGPPSSHDWARAIAVDDSGYVYVTGQSGGSGTDYDYATVKHKPDGDTVWVRRYDGTANYRDGAYALTVDDSGYVYVTGESDGSGTFSDCLTIKYKRDGEMVWCRRFDGGAGGEDAAYAIAVDDSGYVYMTGMATRNGAREDYVTIKYRPNGDIRWQSSYDGPGTAPITHQEDVARAIAVDSLGNVYVTGESWGDGTGNDYATIKYDPNGNELWVERYDGPGNSNDYATDIALDCFGSVYVTGGSRSDGTGDDYATIKYDPNGNELWVERYDGPGYLHHSSDDKANAIAVDDCGNVYVTGLSGPSGYYKWDYVTIKYTPRSYWTEEPEHWYHPPIKVLPNQTRTIILKVFNRTNEQLTYSVTSDHPCIHVDVPPTQLEPGDYATVPVLLDGTGACNGTFIAGNVILTTDEGGGTVDSLRVHAVVAEDYYECPRDPETVDTVDNGVLEVRLNANCQMEMDDIGTFWDVHSVFFRGGTIVATTQDGDTLVGRFMGENDWRAGTRDKLYKEECDVDWEPDFYILYTKNIYIEASHLRPPSHQKWWWWEVSKQVKIFTEDAPDVYKHLVIKYVRVKRHDPPGWWPDTTSFANFEDTHIGFAMDINAPSDSLPGEAAPNIGGYDDVKHIAWQRGSGLEYEDYYCGIALADGGMAGESIVPYGSHCVKNNQYLYPQGGWGWLDGELYQLASTPGNTIQNPDSLVDRSYVVTAGKIDAGTDPNAEAYFTVALVIAPNGLAQLQEYVDSARAIVAREIAQGGLPAICGDVNGDFVVNVGDVVYLVSYLYKGGPAPYCPTNRGDVNNDGVINVGDVVYTVSFLYKGGPEPVCPGIWYW